MSPSIGELYRNGYTDLVPLAHGMKVPRFKLWQEVTHSREVILHHLQHGCNVGMKVKDRIMVADLDCKDLSSARALGIDSPMIAESRRGFHIYMRHLIEQPRSYHDPPGWKGDWKFTGQVVIPPSTVDGWQYQWLNGITPRDRLPVFPSRLIPREPERKPRNQQVPHAATLPEDRRIESARRALSKRHSIAGSGGDLALFKAACLMVQFYQFDAETAFGLLREWNEDGHCVPPWPESRLRYKVFQAQKLMGGVR